MGTAKTLVRWALFLPVGAILIALAQFATVTIAESFSWWVSAPLIVFFGAFIAGAGLVPTRMSPNPRAGSVILIALFVLFEVLSLVAVLPESETYPSIMRVYADLTIVAGAVAGGFYFEQAAA